jgi:hypothetical protein
MELELESRFDPIIITTEENSDNAISIPKVRNKVNVKFGLSRKKRFPVIWIEDITNFNIYRLDVFLKYQGLFLTKIDDDHFAVEKNGLKFILLHEYANILIHEYTKYPRDYKFPSSLKDKTILDIGAGCGETIFFFALKGCKNFVAVEPNPRCANLLQKNAKINSLNVRVYNDVFRKSHLKENFDFIKCDCEGGESILLEEEISKPISLEVHGLDLIKKFREKHFKNVSTSKANYPTCIMRNF